MKAAAQRAATAAKEGRLPGFNAQRVSEGEEQTLEQLSEIFSTPSANRRAG